MALLVVGTASVVTGIIGLFVPLLPTTSFLLVGAACYARTSPRLLARLQAAPGIGALVACAREGRPLPAGTARLTLAGTWAGLAASAAALHGRPLLQLLLLAVGAAVTVHVRAHTDRAVPARAPGHPTTSAHP